MPASELHPDYRAAKPRYKLIRAIINNDAQCYLRTPDDSDAYRSLQYKEDAILTNFTKLTCEGLTGLVFRKKLRVSLPDALDYLLDNVTGGGINLYQFAQYITTEVLKTGRMGLLIDFHNNGKRAFLKPYVAETIINWKTAEINGIVQPYLITLKEEILKDNGDKFSQETEIQYRVLSLENGVYFQEIYNESDVLIDIIDVRDEDGNTFNYIPFVCIGSENNDLAVDNQPLYDLSVLNLGHYRNSADYEESIYICGQPYPVTNVGEASQEEFMSANPNGVAFGSRKGLVLAAGGSFQLAQANPNQLVAQAMREKLEQAAKVGARLIEEAGSGRETAEGARIRYGTAHGALYTLTSNISWGVEAALRVICRFMGVSDSTVSFMLNDQFYEDSVDANVLAQMWMGLDRTTVSKEEIREYMIKGGIPLNQTTDLLALEDQYDPMEGIDDVVA